MIWNLPDLAFWK
jgi:hypothetical protein